MIGLLFDKAADEARHPAPATSVFMVSKLYFD